jgi:hypothetical protein
MHCLRAAYWIRVYAAQFSCAPRVQNVNLYHFDVVSLFILDTRVLPYNHYRQVGSTVNLSSPYCCLQDVDATKNRNINMRKEEYAGYCKYHLQWAKDTNTTQKKTGGIQW